MKKISETFKNASRREFFKTAGVATAAAGLWAMGGRGTAFAQQVKTALGLGGTKSNILFILVDNLGYGELGCYGGGVTRGAPTPRIDSLAKSGTRLLNMNMETQCTPSRSSLITGRFSIRSGTYAVPFGGVPEGLTQWEITIAESLSEAGYATALHGKWPTRVSCPSALVTGSNARSSCSCARSGSASMLLIVFRGDGHVKPYAPTARAARECRLAPTMTSVDGYGGYRLAQEAPLVSAETAHRHGRSATPLASR